MDVEKASPANGTTTEPDVLRIPNSLSPITNSLSVLKETADTLSSNVTISAPSYLTGWKLHVLTTAMCLSVFLSSLEITIVSTSLVSIVDSLKGSSQASWIVTSYLLTYTGFLIIWAKSSDILGRKLCLTTAIMIFLAASGACGASQTTTQLIVFRAFQGIGGAGTMSLSFVVIPEMVPATKYALYGSITSLTFAIAYLLGPVIGGVINDNTTWRWVFLLNLPAGFLALLLLTVGMPAGFPNSTIRTTGKQALSKALFSRIDYPGFFFLLSACAFLVVGLEESGIRYAWSDPTPISFLVLSGLLWIAFFAWAWTLSRGGRSQEPVFSWSFLQNRVFLGVLLVDLFSGLPLFVTIIQIPQRFQIVNSLSPLSSGLRMLPFILSIPLSTAFASMSASKLKIPPIFLLALGCVLQTIGTALMAMLPVQVEGRMYGFEAILGIGLGLNIGSIVILTPNLITGKDQSVAMASITQLRALGGVIGLSLTSNLLNNHVRDGLAAVLSPQQSDALLRKPAIIDTLPSSLQSVVKSTYSEGYNLQMKVMIAFSAAQILGVGLMWERTFRKVA